MNELKEITPLSYLGLYLAVVFTISIFAALFEDELNPQKKER